jgi:gliding motility-associated-like protein
MNNYTLRKLHFFRLLLFGSLFLGSYQARAQFPYAESFKNSTAPGVSFGGNSISFLTGGAGPIAGGYNDPDGSGYLRLTNNSQSQRAYITSEGIVFPANFGLNISFEYFTFGGGGADGICFILYDGSISNPTIGEPGGSLSYAQGTGGPGFQGGYLGIGLDEWGNFSNPSEGRNGGPGQAPNSVALRGLGSGSSGYAYLTGVRTTSLVSPFSIAGGNRNATTSASSGYRKVELELKANPGGGYFISVYITNGATRTLVIGNYLDTQISPATMKFAISASTGGFTNYHEIRNLTFDVNDPNALVAPVANADSATSCAGIVTTFDILANDNGTVNAGGSVNTVAIDLDTSTAGIQTSKTVAGKGTFVYDSETGQVTFTPIDRLITGPVAIDYTFMDTYGQISNISTITYNIGNPPIVGNTVTAPGTSSFTCGNGDPANIVGSTTVTGGTGTFTYQWQKSIDNITFSDIAGATGIDYDPAPISITTYFRRITSSGSCSDSPGSNVVIITITNCIDAVIDSFPTQRPSTTVPTTVGNVTTNDTLNGIPVTTSNTDVTPVTAGPISIDATGVLTLAPNTPSGSYPITYTICEVDPVTGLAVVPSNCDSVTDTVVVLNPIDAVNDILLSSNGASGNPVAGHVLTNDSLNTKPADLTNVNLSVITVATPIGGGLVPVLDPASGIVNVPVGTPSGTYAITYQICEKASASNCDTAIVTIPVLASNITANDDTGIPVSGTIGGISFTNVLSNDTLNGVSVLASDVNITFVSATNPGVTLSGTDVLVAAGTPGGNYTLIYRICEKLNPTNCDEATVTIFVESPSMTISKDGTYMDNNSDGKTNVGDTIIYEFVVTNTGNVPLSNVTVTDNNAVVSGGPISLAVGASDSTTFTAVHTITQADIDAGIVYNSAITSATPPTGPPVMGTSTDPTPCATCPVNPACPTCTDTKTPLAQSPSIALVKTAVLIDENGDGLTQVGETIQYSFVLTNTGNVPLTNITIKDPLPGVVMSGGPISLLPGESDSTSFTGTYAVTVEDLSNGSVSNQAIATGTNPQGVVVKDLSGSNIVNDEPTVLTVEGCKVEVFNLVSPNGDGQNDSFYIEGLDCYATNAVEIYNRWGVLVYSAEDYNNKDVSFKGFSQGRATVKQSEGLPDGTYYYILKYTDLQNKALSKAGYLYLTK